MIIVALVAGIIGGAAYQSFQTQTITPQATIGTGLWLVTMNDTTKHRAFNTTYLNAQNNGGQAMIVQVTLNITSITGGSAGANAEVNQTIAFLHNSTVASTKTIGNLVATVQVQLTFFVPWSFHYRLNSTSSNSTAGNKATIVRWIESVPPTGFGQIIEALVLMRRPAL